MFHGTGKGGDPKMILASDEGLDILYSSAGNHGYGIYFSRLPIPFERDAPQGKLPDLTAHFQHIGLYGYRAATLLHVASLAPSSLELTEKLEQLRWIEHGYRIMTALSEHESWSVDTPEDLKKIESRFV